MCVVALVDQWYLRYGEEKWAAEVKDHIDNTLETYTRGTRRGFEEVIGWLNEHACSRTFGLGTKMPFPGPFDYIIDSLSDSTIYMAYYTVCHILHEGARFGGKGPQADGSHLNMDGKKMGAAGIKPEELTDAVWDYIFLGSPSLDALETTISKDLLKKMRDEFMFWYPMDMRVSGKDLIQNHLTMCLYNHVAMFPKEQWPKSIYCNGHISVDGEKMAKSRGNFLTLENVVNEFSCDATRLALADAGDGLDDANFVRSVTNASILKLTKEIDWVKDTMALAKEGALRTGEYNFFDKVFENQMNKTVASTDKHYAGMLFREAIQCCWFGLQNTRDEYRNAVANGSSHDINQKMHKDLFYRFVEVQALLITPIAPHFAEYLWKEMLGNSTSVQNATFPQAGPVNLQLEMSSAFLVDCLHHLRQNIQKGMKKTKTKPTHGQIYITTEFTEWQKRTIQFVHGVYKEVGEIPKDLSKRVAADPELKKDLKLIMGFAAGLKDQLAKFGNDGIFSDTPIVAEKAVLDEQIGYLKVQLGIDHLEVYAANDEAAPDPAKQKGRSQIGSPSSNFWVEQA